MPYRGIVARYLGGDINCVILYIIFFQVHGTARRINFSILKYSSNKLNKK